MTTTAPEAPAPQVSLRELLDGWLAEAATAQQIELLPEHERYRLYTVDELGRFPDVEWWIEGVLPKRELVGLYGKGDTYKSFVALDWSCWLAAQGHVVVYIVAEGATGIKARIRAWMRFHDVDELPGLRLMPASVAMHARDAVNTFGAAVEAQLPEGERPVMIVVDTLARNFVGGDENSPQHMGAFVDGCEALRRHFDCAVIVIHHTVKDGKTERGTESLRNASFAMYRFVRDGGPLASVRITCDRMKERSAPAPVALAPKVVPAGDGEDVDGLVADWPYDGGAMAGDPSLQARIIEVLGDLGDGIAISQRKLERTVGGNNAAVRETAQRLVADPSSPVTCNRHGRSLMYRLEVRP